MKKLNKIITTALLGLATLPVISAAQSVALEDVDVSLFPKMKAKLMIVEQNGLLRRNLKSSSIALLDNGTQVPATMVCQPENLDQGVSFVLAVDLSRSMESKLGVVKSTMKHFIDNLKYRRFECGVVGLANNAMRKYGFSPDQDELANVINSLGTAQGSDIFGALAENTRGAFQFTETAVYNPVLVIVTDNLPNSDFDVAALRDYARNRGLKVHLVWLGSESALPSEYKQIATASGGSACTVRAEQGDMDAKMLKILYESFGLELCHVEWTAADNCSAEHSLSLKYLDGTNVLTSNGNYMLSTNQLRHLSFAPSNEIDFGFLPIGTKQTKPITIEAVNADVNITAINSSNSDFKLTDFAPCLITKGTSKTFQIEYSSQDSLSKMAIFTIESNSCSGSEFYAGGGSPFVPPSAKNLKVEFPNGAERLVAGRDTLIRWSGALPNALFAIDYTTSSGASWTPITTNASGTSYLWRAPKFQSDNLMIRVRQLASGFANDSIKTFVGQKSELTAIAWSPNGVQIGTGGLDGSVRLWDVSTSAVAWTATFAGKVNSLEFSPNGQYLAGASDDNSIIVWNAITGAEYAKLTGHTNKVNSLSWLSDTRLASGSNDKAVIVWDVVSKSVAETITSASEPVYSVVYSPDGKTLAYGSADNKLRLRSVANSTEVVIPTTGAVKSVAWSPDSKRIAVSTADMLITVLDVANSSTIKQLNAALWVNSISWSPDGHYIISGNNDGSMFLWEDGTWNRTELSLGLTSVYSAKWGPVGPVVATANADSIARVYILNSIPRELQKDESDAVFSTLMPTVDVAPIDFGNVYLGNSSDSTFSSIIRNTSALPVRITNVVVSGFNQKEFSVAGGERKFVLAPNESRAIELNFKPSSFGTKQASLEFDIEDGFTAGAMAPIVAYSLQEEIANSAVGALNFGEIAFGTSKELQFDIVNNSSDVIYLNTQNLLSDVQANYAITYPNGDFSILPKLSQSITIKFTPQFVGSSSAMFRISRGKGMEVLLYGNSTGEKASMSLAPASVSARSGETIEIPIVATNVSGIAQSGISKIDAYLRFNPNLLLPTDGTDEGIILNGERIVPFTLTLSDLQSPKKLKFRTMLGDAESSSLRIINAEALTGAATINLGDATFALTDVCHEGSPRLIGESGTLVPPIAMPNPVGSKSQLIYQIIENGMYKLSIYDASGTLVRVLVDEFKKAGTYTIDFDARSYPAGAYLLVLETPTQVRSSRLEVVK